MDEALLGTINRDLLDMPSRALSTAAGHKDASGKIKSDQPETFPENGCFQVSASVCLFFAAPLHVAPCWFPLPPSDPCNWPLVCVPKTWPHGSQHFLSSSTLAHDWPGCRQTCSRLVVRLGFYLAAKHVAFMMERQEEVEEGGPEPMPRAEGLPRSEKKGMECVTWWGNQNYYKGSPRMRERTHFKCSWHSHIF